MSQYPSVPVGDQLVKNSTYMLYPVSEVLKMRNTIIYLKVKLQSFTIKCLGFNMTANLVSN
jgi:hypothetical protein